MFHVATYTFIFHDLMGSGEGCWHQACPWFYSPVFFWHIVLADKLHAMVIVKYLSLQIVLGVFTLGCDCVAPNPNRPIEMQGIMLCFFYPDFVGFGPFCNTSHIFDFGNKFHQMELSDAVKKILRVVNRLSTGHQQVVNRSSHWSSKVVARCHQGHQVNIFSCHLGHQVSSAVVTLAVRKELQHHHLGS